MINPWRRPTRPISRRTLLTAGGVAAGAWAFGGCGPELERIRIASGEPGGSYVQFARLVAEVAQDRGLARQVDVVTTTGSVANLELLRDGEVDLALSLIDAAAGAPDGIVSVGRVYQNYLQCLVLADSGIETVADLAGRTVSIGAQGSGTARTAELMLRALGVTGLTQTQLPLTGAVNALGSGWISAMFWSGGIPVPEADRLGTEQLRLVDLTAALARLESAQAELYFRTLVPAGIYGSTEATATIGIANLLLCRREASPALARGLVDLLVADAGRLVPSGAAGIQFLTPSNLIDTAPIDLHPDAAAQYQRRYR